MQATSHDDLKGHTHGHSFGGGPLPFFAGLALSLVFGWWIFPHLLFSANEQPINFNHLVHVEDSGMACEDCHYFREDGTYNGLPSTESCAECHAEPLGETEAEKTFVEEYVIPGKEVPWRVYQHQPDNVFFSHAAHSLDSCNQCHDYEESQLCGECHPDVGRSETTPVYYENRLTGYSKDTMKMWKCEKCHAHPDHLDNTRSSNACFVCHN